jgi:hypothetical protein
MMLLSPSPLTGVLASRGASLYEEKLIKRPEFDSAIEKFVAETGAFDLTFGKISTNLTLQKELRKKFTLRYCLKPVCPVIPQKNDLPFASSNKN